MDDEPEHFLGLAVPACVIHVTQACRCAAVSTDSIMAYVAVSEDAVTRAGIRRSEERCFRSSIVTGGDNDNYADTFFPMGEGVCG